MKTQLLLLLSAALLLCSSQVFAQRINVCNSDSVVRISAISPGNTEATVKRQECKQILMSESTYNSLMIAAIQGDSLRKQSLRYINTVNAEVALRDSITHLMSNFQKTQEKVIVDYQGKLQQSMAMTEAAIKNTEFCADSLKKAKRNNVLYALGGGIAGTLVGVLIGAIIVR
jgi:hypothetical protein